MTDSVLITGALGFAGRYLCEFLHALPQRPGIIAVDIHPDNRQERHYDEFYRADISDADQVNDIVNKIKPCYVIHLAGTFATDDTQQIYKVNLLSMAAVLEAVLKHASDAVVIAAGSAAEYGKVDTSEIPISEQTPCRPVITYGLSKYLATQITQFYHRVHGVCTMVVRPFQLIGKGVTTRLAPGAFAERLLQAREHGLREIKVGNLQSSRDFLDVRDAVRAIWMLCQKPAPGQIFNLCSSRPVKMEDLVRQMIEAVGGGIKPVLEEKYLRGNTDVNTVYGSFEKIQNHCGWHPEILLSDSICKMFE